MDEIAKGSAPEFRTREEFAEWLEGKPREWSFALAAQAALRVLPLVSRALPPRNADGERLQRFLRLTSAVFHCTAIGRVATKYPTRWIDVASAAFAAFSAADAAKAYAPADNVDDAFALGFAATLAAFAANATNAANAFAHVADFADTNEANDANAWEALTADARFLAAGGAPSALTVEPLWREHAPQRIDDAWAQLRRALPEGEHWEVWIDWYEARLKKSRWSEKKELIYASVPLDVWEKGHVAANTWIYEELQKLKRKKKPESDDASPKLVGAHVFVVADGRIDARKDDGRPDFPAVARSFYETARRRAKELAERVKRWQADTKLEGKVAQLLEHLTENPDEATLGYLIASMLALQAEHRNWDNEEGRKEIPLDLLTLLDETAEAVASYVSGFEIGHKILASRLAFDLKIERGALERVQTATQEIKAIAQASPVVKPSVVEALDEPVRAAKNARDDKERAEQLSLGLTEIVGYMRAALQGVGEVASKTGGKLRRKLPETLSDGIAKGAGRAANHVTYGVLVGASIGAGVWASSLGEEGVKLIIDTWHEIRRITPELKSGNPLQKLEKKIGERMEELARTPADSPSTEAPKSKTSRTRDPKVSRKKK